MSKKLELVRFNQLPSEALLLLLSRSGGDKNLLGYTAELEALTLFFDDEKHPVAGKHPLTIEEDEEQADTVDAPRNDFFLSDFTVAIELFPMLQLVIVVCCVAISSSSSTSI
jgi:hypothetical protein